MFLHLLIASVEITFLMTDLLFEWDRGGDQSTLSGTEGNIYIYISIACDDDVAFMTMQSESHFYMFAGGKSYTSKANIFDFDDVRCQNLYSTLRVLASLNKRSTHEGIITCSWNSTNTLVAIRLGT